MSGETLEPPVSPVPPPRSRFESRMFAVIRIFVGLAQIIAVSGIPTQLVVATILIFTLGMSPYTDEGLSLEFVATVSFIDTALISLAIFLFFKATGEHSSDVLLGRRPIWPEVWRGLALIPVVFVILTAVVASLRALWPWLQTVPENPLAAFMRNPFDAAIFLVVVVLAGGVREELQRGFILHRSAQHFSWSRGGPQSGAWLGNLGFGLVFGALHYDQGADVAIAIGLMGMGWGALYIWRKSVVASMVNHAGFNGAMVLQQVLASSMGLK